MVVGQDGTVWWLLESDQGGFSTLYRYDRDEWQRFDVVEPLVAQHGAKRLEVTPDGRLWVLSRNTFGGAHLCDGDKWTPYLEGVMVPGGDVAPDGSVWLVGGAR